MPVLHPRRGRGRVGRHQPAAVHLVRRQHEIAHPVHHRDPSAAHDGDGRRLVRRLHAGGRREQGREPEARSSRAHGGSGGAGVSAAWFDRLSAGLTRSRDAIQSRLASVAGRSRALDDGFFEGVEEALIAADVGAAASAELVDALRAAARKQKIQDPDGAIAELVELVAAEFPPPGADPLAETPAVLLLVGVNGSGKTTTAGKLANEARQAGRAVVIASADTYRAAAIEQLRVWAERSGAHVVERERGADPASVAFDAVAYGDATGADFVIVDTAGRLHTSKDLMEELKKVDRVVRKRAAAPVKSLLVIDATAGQNALQQAREFHAALGLDGVILTKLDGTAKGGIVVAVARELGVPIVRIGVGEALEDMHAFDAREFARALIGASA
ncbi:signal recognition particle receptor FtsY [Coriobacteriaceae bacterium EMTCatB1]|nr:signal recognition particle receptor FtsY [Coriobacteriaceae bacterium EMTCatB1]